MLPFFNRVNPAARQGIWSSLPSMRAPAGFLGTVPYNGKIVRSCIWQCSGARVKVQIFLAGEIMLQRIAGDIRKAPKNHEVPSAKQERMTPPYQGCRVGTILPK